jgi:hypothetical protein
LKELFLEVCLAEEEVLVADPMVEAEEALVVECPVAVVLQADGNILISKMRLIISKNLSK